MTVIKDGSAGLGEFTPEKRIIKVLAIVQKPYIYKKAGAYTGIVYDIWKGIMLI